ncbi:hypothetical protein FAES_3623 [Fibrella aestuarina BUZ 2]|uniref:Uncharacterized protein n=1 Tax=Fibrella aestuarina BUZ 2 TaxID=1166018 RepID=I0KBX7_9BACT|nr:hypothetical protein [Fibrella aestuarina]CCH01630.1 hypothetical protein FAES_3623 [Fibrella aestuarina BUZ 2]
MIRITNTAGLGLLLVAGQKLLTEVAAGWLADGDALPPSGYSYPVKFPINEGNRRFLGAGFLPNAARPTQQLPVTLNYGLLQRSCVLSYRISAGMGEGTLRFNGGEVIPDLKRLTLQEVLTEPVVLPPAASGNVYDLAGRMLAAAQAPIGTQPLTFFPIRNELFFPDNEVERLGQTIYYGHRKVNTWNGRFLTGPGYPVVPFFYLGWVLEQILAHVGYRVAGDWLDLAETRRRVIVNQTSIRGRSFSAAGYHIVPGDHLPPIKCSEFLKAIRAQFGLLFEYDSTTRYCTISRCVDVAAAPQPVDLTPYVSGPWGIETGKNEGVRLQAGRNSADELYQQRTADGGMQPIASEEVTLPGLDGQIPATAATLPVATTQQIWEDSQDGQAKWIVPTLRQPGNVLDVAYNASERYLDANGRQKNPMSLVLLTYWGMQPDSGGRLYPFGSPGVRNARWESLGRAGVGLTGPGGQWQDTLRLYYYFRDQTRPLTVRLRLPVPLFGQLRLHQPARLNLDRLGMARYLIEKIQAEDTGEDGYCLARLQLLTIPPALELAPFVQPAVVWVQLTSTTDVAPVVETIGERRSTRWGGTLSLRVWGDKARTQPLAGTPVSVQVRVRSWSFITLPNAGGGQLLSYNEYPMTLTSSGDRAVIYTGLVRTINESTTNGADNQTTVWEYALDPGDDYNLF